MGLQVSITNVCALYYYKVREYFVYIYIGMAKI